MHRHSVQAYNGSNDRYVNSAYTRDTETAAPYMYVGLVGIVNASLNERNNLAATGRDRIRSALLTHNQIINHLRRKLIRLYAKVGSNVALEY